MYKVVNKYKHTSTKHDFYIGRGSGLGNPWTHLDSKYPTFKTVTREEAVNKFKDYFYEQIQLEDSELKNNLEEIINLHKKHGEVNLVCFCKPKACHGDIIAEYLNNLK